MPGDWTSSDVWHLFVVTSRAGNATLYVGPDRAASGTLATPAEAPRCAIIFGQTGSGDDCSDPGTANSSGESPLRAAFDDIRIFGRAISANEVRASWLD